MPVRKLRPSTYSALSGRLLVSILMLGLIVSVIDAQTRSSTDGTTPLALSPGAPPESYALSDFEHINPYNGNLNLAMPMLGIGGRGGTPYTMMLQIERHWRVEHSIFTTQGVSCDPESACPGSSYDYYTPSTNWWTGTSTMDGPQGPGSLRIRNEGRPSSTCQGLVKPTLTRLTFTAPGGTEYELRDQLNGGKAIAAALINACTTQDVSRGTVFVTADGSSATFISDYEIIDDQNAGASTDLADGYLMLRDGTRYRVEGGLVRWLRDRNGNKVTFGYAGGRVNLITDSLNRQVTIAYATTTPGYDQINFTGFGGAPRTMRIWHNSLSAVLRADSGLASYAQLFPQLNHASGMFNPTVTSALELPNGRQYQFYYNSFGELARLVLPTGGAIEYDWAAGVEGGYDSGIVQRASVNTHNQYQIYRRVITRRVFADGGNTPESITTFSRPEQTGLNIGFVEVDHRNANGLLLAAEKHYYYGFASDSLYLGPLGYPAWNDGKEYKTEQYNTDGINLTTMLRRVEQTWQPGTPISSNPTAAINARVVDTVTTLGDTNQVSRQTSLNPNNANDKGFDEYNNQTDIWEYDFGSGAPGALVRHTHTDFVTTNSVNGLAYDSLKPNNTTADPAATIHLRSLPKASRVYAVNPANGVETLAAQRTFTYDEPAYPILAGSTTGWTDPATSARGNVTTTGQWLDTSGVYLQTHAQYDQAGSLRSVWDANGNQSQIEYSSAYACAYPTLTRTAVPDPSGAYGTTSNLVTTSVYDFSTGLVTSTVDPNGQSSTFEYTDPLDRLTQINTPDGGRTTNIYVDVHQCGPYVETRTLLDSSGSETDSWQFVDGLGRPYLVESLENQDPNNPYLRVDTQYDAMGRASSVSSPYRSAGCTSTVNPSGRWTQTTFDSLGRTTHLKTTADNAVATTSYSGNTVTVTDQAGKKRRSVTDGLGRLIRVDEPDTQGNLGLANAPAQPTSYAYDALGNLRRVDQGGQQRFFMYDSLSRLIRAKNPEQAAGGLVSNITDPVTGNPQWSMAYGYDNNGNLTARVDARDVTTTYTYDALNRNTTVRYTDGTKDIDRHYDNPTAGKNGKGRFWYSNWDSNNNYRFDTHLAIDEYDAMGRPLNYRQHFLTNAVASPQFNVRRTYDKAGHVLTQTYPSGHTASYGYDIVGRLNNNTGNLGDGVARTYATAVTYSEFGGLQQEQFGTETPLYHKLHYNVRGQLYDIRLSSHSLQANEWDWNRGAVVNYFSSNFSWGGNSSGSGPDNNGNVTQQLHFVPANDAITDYSYTQARFSYDALNRLTSTSETHGGPSWASGQDYVQTYDYDRWGNRTINQGQTSANVPHPNYTADTNSNRLVAPTGYNYGYDNAGNQTNDNYTGQGSRTYDAENRLKQAWANNQWQTYTYDADGRRIKRNVNGAETWQVYGMDGELLAEYASGAAPFLPATEYGYRNGALLVTITNGDPQRLTRFVTNLYYGALQRDPTSAELQDQVNQLAAAGATSQSQLLTVASQIARSLFTATNYETSPYRSDAQYTADLYYAYLQRAPDDGGLGWWAGQVPGSGRANVSNAFEASGEFQTLVANLYGTAASDNERTEHFVNNFYLGSYGRNATSTDLQQQRDALNAAAAQGLSQVQAQAESFGRSLFAAQVNDGNLSNAQYVTNLYEAFLQRGPDAGGLGWWSGQATLGQGRQNVLNAFATCGAFRELSGTLYREANWLVADHLGTPRMIVAKSGSLTSIKRHDYLPFGEELVAGTGGRTAALGYAGDNTRQKFTSKERDNETGLDYFLARYYSSTQGRFTSPDEFTGGPHEIFGDVLPPTPLLYAEPTEPQSLNKYNYCLGNPLRYIDPDGHQTTQADGLIIATPKVTETALNIAIGLGKVADNTLRGMNNIMADFGAGNAKRVDLHSPSNLTQAMTMVATEDVMILGALLGGRSPAGVMAAEAKGPVVVASVTASAKNATQMGAELSGQIGKNSVGYRTPNKVGHIDLKGKPHFDKATKQTIPTPHVQERPLHSAPGGGRVNTGAQTTRPATKQDIRTARKIVERRKKE